MFLFSDMLKVGVVPGYEGVVQTSGFLVPGKTKGQLQLYNINEANPAATEINIASKDVTKNYVIMSIKNSNASISRLSIILTIVFYGKIWTETVILTPLQPAFITVCLNISCWNIDIDIFHFFYLCPPITTAVEEQNFVWLENPGAAVSGIQIDYIKNICDFSLCFPSCKRMDSTYNLQHGAWRPFP